MLSLHAQRKLKVDSFSCVEHMEHVQQGATVTRQSPFNV